MLYIIGLIILISFIVVILKKVLHLRVEDGNYSENDDYLERRVKKDEEDK